MTTAIQFYILGITTGALATWLYILIVFWGKK